MLPNEIPEYHRKAAYKQWGSILVPYAGNVIANIWMGALVAHYAEPSYPHPFNEPVLLKHNEENKANGSSGRWSYQIAPQEWLNNYNNLEYGSLGEPDGDWSAVVGGKERTWWAKYKQSWRNPYNTGKRTSDFYSCFINECDIYWVDSRDPGKVKTSGDIPIILSDKAGFTGWEFVWAVRRSDNKHYYGYRHVKGVKDQTRVGFKIKSAHSQLDEDGNRILQGPSDLDKSFTAR